MRYFFLTLIFSFSTNAAFAVESIICLKDFLMSSSVGIKNGYNGKDEYLYESGTTLVEISNGRPVWRYVAISENNGLITAALRQKSHPTDTQVVVIDRANLTFYKTVVQGDLRFTSFGTCSFHPK